MKTRKTILMTILTAFITAYSLTTFSQTFPEPDFALKPVYFDKSDSTLKKPEYASAKFLGSSRIDLNVTYSYSVSTPKSDVRFPKNELPRFIIKLDPNQDPADMFSIVKGEEKKNKRIFVSVNQNASDNYKKTIVKLEFKKIESGVYEIVLPKDMQSGEYVIFIMGMGTISAGNLWNLNCFGID